MNPINKIKSLLYKNQDVRKSRQFLYALKSLLNTKKKLVVFAIPFGDMVNGGVLSINKIYNTSKKILKNEANVFLSTMNDSQNFVKFSKFKNDSFIININIIFLFLKLRKIDEIIIHLPEYYFEPFMDSEFKKNCGKFKRVKSIIINVLNQKIEEMPEPSVFEKYRKMYGNIFTITAAHKKYATSEFQRKYDVPYHYLSVDIDESYYPKLNFSEKENLILISPDLHPNKERIVSILQKSLPNFEFFTIKNVTFEQYKQLVAKAKFQITFGEGLDGYFIEPYFCNSIGFAVYNEEFFTKKYQKLETVYESYEYLENSIVSDILKLNTFEDEYIVTWEKGFEVCKTDYNTANFLKNLSGYYKKEYKVIDSKEL